MGSKSIWKDQESWKQHGIERDYEKRNPMSLSKSKNLNERSWYHHGSYKKWLSKFSFASLERWPDQESWKQHGIERDYEKRNPRSLESSEDLNERSWYKKGSRSKWAPNFNFNRKIFPLKWKDQESWKQHGIEQDYEKRNSKSLNKSKDPNERSWYGLGCRSGWLSDFNFKIFHSKWKDQESWKQHGIEQDYEKRNPGSLCKSKNSSERSWYIKGCRRKWLSDFNFNRKIFPLKWKDQESWKQHGIERDYEKRRYTSLIRSGDPEEKSWYTKGAYHRWLSDFPFLRGSVKIHSEEQLQKFLEENEPIKKIALLSNANGYVGDVAALLFKLCPERFPSQANLAKMLPKAVKKITSALSPYSFGHIMSDFDFLPPMEIEIRRNLEDLLFMVMRDQYKVKFNENPVETIEEIRKFPSRNKNTNSLVRRVLNHYDDIYNFEIPGFGKMNER
ncbi:hypothetical protein KAJ38_01320 [Candidatus Pacearchaeota archaeon]|nr:hypothetical protein [Candidatus Pacearchaeota archaeon]